MAWPAVGVVRGGESSAASQPATGGRGTRQDRRCFGRLEQEDQRLKKHYGRWMDIVRSLQLESFIFTKLTKPLVCVNLVGPELGFGREHIAHSWFVRMYIPFLILTEFTTAHLQFVKSTCQLLARTMINNFKQPHKTELKKNPTFWWDPKYYYPKFLVRLNIISK